MSGQKFFGIMLVVIGLAFLVDYTSELDVLEYIKIFWPLVLIIAGLYHLFKRSGLWFGSFALIIIGVILQVNNLDIIEDDFKKLIWPVIIIMVGMWIIMSHKKRTGEDKNIDNSNNYFALFSGINTNNESDDFKGGNVTAIFGGVELNLCKASIKEEKVFLDATAIFGGVEIKVPENWKVNVTGLPIFGGYENKTKNPDESSHELNIRCLAAFGGVEINNG